MGARPPAPGRSLPAPRGSRFGSPRRLLCQRKGPSLRRAAGGGESGGGLKGPGAPLVRCREGRGEGSV